MSCLISQQQGKWNVALDLDVALAAYAKFYQVLPSYKITSDNCVHVTYR